MRGKNRPFTRRAFIDRTIGCGMALTVLASQRTRAAIKSYSAAKRPILGVKVGQPTTIPNNFGDTWAVAWADDDNLYSPSNDTLGFDIPDFLTEQRIRQFQTDFPNFSRQLSPLQKGAFRYDPIAFNRIEGTSPLELRGTTVNRMEDYVRRDGYDTIFEAAQPQNSADNRGWKSSGCTSVDGVLYWTVARHKYPENTNTAGLRQNAANASLLKSVDFGKTWTRSEQDNLKAPMFAGSSFATPYLIDYCRTRALVDGSDQYVYAISNNGFWDNGDALTLGRVARARIGTLEGADWEFYIGGDGMQNGSWSRDIKASAPIFSRPGKLGETGAVYLPDRQRYMMIGWHYPAGSGYLKGASSTTVWDFYESPKPWGPWTHLDSIKWSPQGYYCPSICPKFQSSGRIYVLTAGDFNNWWDFYRLTVVPVDLV